MPVDGICSATSCIVLHGNSFVVDVRYKMRNITDRSDCGIVCSAEDLDSGEKVAVTRIVDVFEHRLRQAHSPGTAQSASPTA